MKRTDLHECRSKTVLRADGVHVLLEVHVQELENEVELGLGVNDVEQPVRSCRRVRAGQPTELGPELPPCDASSPSARQPPAVSRPTLPSSQEESVGLLGEYARNDVVVFELLEQTDLPDGRAGHSLVLGFESDLLEGNDPVRLDLLGLVDDSVRA